MEGKAEIVPVEKTTRGISKLKNPQDGKFKQFILNRPVASNATENIDEILGYLD